MLINQLSKQDNFLSVWKEVALWIDEMETRSAPRRSSQGVFVFYQTWRHELNLQDRIIPFIQKKKI
jgi:hypothetical protein